MAAFAPMPRPSVRTTARVNTGAFSSVRTPRRAFCQIESIYRFNGPWGHKVPSRWYIPRVVLRNLLRRAVPRSIRLWALHPRQSARWVRHVFGALAGRAASLPMRSDWELRCHPAAVEAFAFERDQPELREELEGFIAACGEGMVLFDIGAHYGLFALTALRWSGGTARVGAVDPSAPALEGFDGKMRLARGGSPARRRPPALA